VTETTVLDFVISIFTGIVTVAPRTVRVQLQRRAVATM
jgi:hypothetical protein